MSDEYEPRGSSLELSIGLTVADVASLPGYGLTTFALAGAAPIEGAQRVTPDLVAHGVRRIVDYYVLGMHADYGLSNFAAPTPFLLLLRRLADDLYAAVADGPRVDASEGNAEMEPIIRALYPEAFT